MGKKRRAKTVGLAPGSLVFTGEQKVSVPDVQCIQYNEQELTEQTLSPSAPLPMRPEVVTWINVSGIHDAALIEAIGTQVNLHPLTMEDIVHPDQRPKREDMGNYLFLVLKMLSFDDKKNVVAEQVSVIVGERFLISFQEEKHRGDVFGHVRERLRMNRGKIRRCGPDYLAYSLIDSIVDYYFLILEDIGEQVEVLEQKLMTDPRAEFLSSIYSLKRTMLALRRNIWPARELLLALQRDDSPLLDKSIAVYLQDVYGHAVQIVDHIEVLRETLSSMLEIYLSSVSYRLNSVMKFLTLVATVFMPLTFVVGLYGMNFRHMPELEWTYGYPAVLGLMAAIGILMLFYFKKKGWLHNDFE